MDASPLPKSDLLVETRRLSKSFAGHVAVDQVDLRVRAGEIFGLIGPNGAGKSTLIKMLTMLLPPTSGDAFIADLDLTRQSREGRAAIGYVPQLVSADGALTGYENLLRALRHHHPGDDACHAGSGRALRQGRHSSPGQAG